MPERIYDLAKNKLASYLHYLLIFISLLFVAPLVRNIVRVRQAGEKIGEAEKKVEKLRQENEELKDRLEVVKKDVFVEKQARDKLGLAKEGEIIVVLPEEEILRKLAPRHEEEEETLPDPNWKKWAQLFGLYK
jgi:cell division protein FtsB